jgi:hypothetical protein
VVFREGAMAIFIAALMKLADDGDYAHFGVSLSQPRAYIASG